MVENINEGVMEVMNYHERKIKPTRLTKYIDFVEEYGNSVALYIFLLLLVVGVWIALPVPSPNWVVNGKVIGWSSVLFISVTALHGLLWFILTRESLSLRAKTRYSLSMSIKFVKPLHMMTGMIGLGLAFMHGFAYLSLVSFSSIFVISGGIAILTLLILAIDGIGLMVTPFLSRKVHRWIALIFLFALAMHLSIILF